MAEEIAYLQRAVEDSKKSLGDVGETNDVLEQSSVKVKSRVSAIKEDRRHVLAETHVQQELMEQEERQNAEMKMDLERFRQDRLLNQSREHRINKLEAPLAIKDADAPYDLKVPSDSMKSEFAAGSKAATKCSVEANATTRGSRTRFLLLSEGV